MDIWLSKMSILGHTKLISDICYYDPNGDYILSCSADNDIRLWRSFSPNCLTIYRSHLSPVWCLSVHSKSDRFASGSMDQTVRLWTPDQTNILRTFIYHTDDINTLTFHPNGKYLASGSNDGLIILWALEQAQPARILKSSSSIEQLTFTSDGNQLISINYNHEQNSDHISIWDIRSANEIDLIKNIPSHRCLLKSCQIENTNKFVTGFKKSFLFFDINSNSQKTGDSFRSDFSNEDIKRLIHLSSKQSNKLIAIVE
jgi:transcription initiation factor TFIID subunit 5